MDSLAPTVPFGADEAPDEEWPHILSPLLYLMGAAVAFWGSALLRLAMRLASLLLAPLHRYVLCFTPRLGPPALLASDWLNTPGQVISGRGWERGPSPGL